MLHTALMLTLAAWLAGCAPQRPAEAPQVELNQAAANTMVAADDELQRFLSTYADHLPAAQLALLRQAQDAWADFRRKQCAFESSGVLGGSIYPLVYAQCMTRRSQQRLAQLQALTRCAEGDLPCPTPPLNLRSEPKP